MRIFDGELEVSDAAKELIRLARTQRDAAINFADARVDAIREYTRDMQRLLNLIDVETVNAAAAGDYRLVKLVQQICRNEAS